MIRIKDRYIVGEPDPAIPQQKSIIKDSDPIEFLIKASKILKCDLERIKNSPRVRESDKLNRDLLLYSNIENLVLWARSEMIGSAID